MGHNNKRVPRLLLRSISYQKFQIQNRARYLWDFKPEDLEVKKWLLMPMPLSEINKGYGLVQNPGW